MQAAQCPSSAAQDARDVADIGVRRLQKFTNVSELWSGRVDPPGPERCRMHVASVLRFSHDAISETRSMRSRRGTAGSHAGSASHGLGPRRPPTPLRRLRVAILSCFCYERSHTTNCSFVGRNYAIRLCTMNTRNTVHANPYKYTKQETPTPHRRQHPLHRHPHRPHRLPRNPLPDAAVAPLPKDDEIRDAELPDAGGGVAAI